MDRPWTAGTDQMGARYSTIARNFVRAGFKDFEQRTHLGEPSPELVYPPYRNHPPLVPLAIAVAFRLFDTDAAWAARIAVAPAALGCLLLIFLLARRAHRRRLAAAALLLAVMAPAACFYGLFPDPVGWWFVLFELAFVALLAPWLVPGAREPGWAHGFALAAVFLGGMMAEWHMALLLPFLGIAWLVGGRRGGLAVLLPIGLAVPVAALAYRVLLPPTAGGGYEFVLRKLATFSQWGPDFWRQVGCYLVSLYGWPLLGLVAVGLIGLLGRTVRGRAGRADGIAWTLLAFYAMVTTLYPRAALLHDYFHVYALAGFAFLGGDAAIRLHDTLRARLGARAGALAAGILMAAIGIYSVRQALVRDRVWDAHVPRVLFESRVMREAVKPDEVVASTIGLDANESIGYYADRMIFPLVGTPMVLRALRESPWSPAAFVIPRHQVASFPELVTYLDARGPGRVLPFHRVYDLRPTGPEGDRSKATGRSEPPALDDADDPGAPTAVTGHVVSGRFEIDWRPIDDPSVVGYRVFCGSAPGFYLGRFDVDAPPLVREALTACTIHVVVAPRLADGRVGARSKDIRVEVLSAGPIMDHVLAVVLVILLTAALYGAGLVCGRRRSREP